RRLAGKQQVEQVEGLFVVVGHRGKADAVLAGPARQLLSVTVPDRSPALLDALPSLQLGAEDRRQQVGREEAGAEVGPGVLVDLAAEEPGPVGPFLAQDLGPVDETLVVDHERPALPAGNVLGFVKALSRQPAEGPQQAATVTAEKAMRVVL